MQTAWTYINIAYLRTIFDSKVESNPFELGMAIEVACVVSSLHSEPSIIFVVINSNGYFQKCVIFQMRLREIYNESRLGDLRGDVCFIVKIPNQQLDFILMKGG